MSKGTILIVEDETNLGSTLKNYLNSKQFNAQWAQNCHEAKTLFKQHQPDIILMDKGLPDGDGFDLARDLRSIRKDFVLLFVSAYNDPSSRLEGLEIGADDYLTKPFELKELTLRLEKILRLQQQTSTEEIRLNDLTFWPKKFEIQDALSNIHPLSLKETRLLQLFLSRQNEVLSRDEIIDQIWGEDAFPSNRTIDNMVVKFRKWIETSKTYQAKISSIRGVGYKWETK